MEEEGGWGGLENPGFFPSAPRFRRKGEGERGKSCPFQGPKAAKERGGKGKRKLQLDRMRGCKEEGGREIACFPSQ